MFKLIGWLFLLMVAVAAVAAVAILVVTVVVIVAGIKAGQVGWRWWQARPEQQVKRARTRVLKPGEIDVRGF